MAWLGVRNFDVVTPIFVVKVLGVTSMITLFKRLFETKQQRVIASSLEINSSIESIISLTIFLAFQFQQCWCDYSSPLYISAW